jgi:RimJ/RimL family protein N-acetyltransferase
MDFESAPELLVTLGLEMEYFLVPWDSEIVGFPVAQINRLHLRDANRAAEDYEQFVEWCGERRVRLCSCRVPHGSVEESIFLQAQGFRFIELNYHPYLGDLQQLQVSSDGIEVLPADETDEEELAAMAATVFRHGRFHQDPQLGAAMGNHRYEAWMRNSFRRASQTPLKCVHHDKTVGFFVVEYPSTLSCRWSLIGLAPGLEGTGWGYRVWQAMLKHHRDQGIERVETSISSHNTAVLNLYVKLGFRFPTPFATFHWHARTAS